MQKTVIVKGNTNPEFGRTIADAVNELLKKHQAYKLTVVKPLFANECSATVLFVFDTVENQNQSENQDQPN